MCASYFFRATSSRWVRAAVRMLVPTASVVVPSTAALSAAGAPADGSSSSGAPSPTLNNNNGWPAMSLGTRPGVVRRADGAVQCVRTALNYQKPSVDLVWSARDAAGSDDGLHGADWAVTDVEIRNARATGSKQTVRSTTTLSQNGVEMRFAPSARVDFKDRDAVVGSYYAECEALVKTATGARRVVAFDHNVRSTAGAGVESVGGTSVVQPPTAIVHGDYTSTSAPRRVLQLSEAPKLNDVASAKPRLDAAEATDAVSDDGRFAIVNVWRPIKPVESAPLAFCDARTADSADLLTFEIRYADRVGENYFARPNPKHDWLYFPDMRPDEAVLLKTWDSGVSWDAQRNHHGALFVLHSAFMDPSSPANAPPRESIEVRCAVLY